MTHLVPFFYKNSTKKRACFDFIFFYKMPKNFILKNVLGKLHHPKIQKNCPVEMNKINGAVFCEFLGDAIFQSTFLNKQILLSK